MNQIKIYEYKNCGTCKNALKFLDEHKIVYQKLAIRETPPTVPELEQMLTYLGGDIRKLFNTSGLDYKALNMKNKITKLSQKKLLELLASNGNLVKRPFVLTSNFGIVGFKVDEWAMVFR